MKRQYRLQWRKRPQMQRIMSTVGQRLRKNVNWPILGRHLAQEDLPCCPTWTALIEVRPVHTSRQGPCPFLMHAVLLQSHSLAQIHREARMLKLGMPGDRHLFSDGFLILPVNVHIARQSPNRSTAPGWPVRFATIPVQRPILQHSRAVPQSVYLT